MFLNKRMFFGPPKVEKPVDTARQKLCSHKGYVHIIRGDKEFCYGCGAECASPNS